MVRLTHQQAAFKSQIQAAAQDSPRFLFRFWHNRSGGNADLNNIYSITPLAFYGTNQDHQPLHMVSPQVVNEIATNHVGWRYEFATIFSSWSQSFTFVYDWAMDYLGQDVHISLLDTKQLGANNVVLHTSAVRRILQASGVRAGFEDVFTQEFMVFGPIHSPAYTTTSLFDFLQTRDVKMSIDGHDAFLPSKPHYLFPRGSSLQSRIDAVRRLSRPYGHLAIVMAAHLIVIAMHSKSETNQFVEAIFNALIIPEEWIRDSSIIRANSNYHGLEDPEQAERILRRLVVRKYGEAEAQRTSQEAFAATLGTETEDTPQQAAQNAIMVVDRVMRSEYVPRSVKEHYPKMVAELLISMNGQEAHNAFIEGFAMGYRRG